MRSPFVVDAKSFPDPSFLVDSDVFSTHCEEIWGYAAVKDVFGASQSERKFV